MKPVWEPEKIGHLGRSAGGQGPREMPRARGVLSAALLPNFRLQMGEVTQTEQRLPRPSRPRPAASQQRWRARAGAGQEHVHAWARVHVLEGAAAAGA